MDSKESDKRSPSLLIESFFLGEKDIDKNLNAKINLDVKDITNIDELQNMSRDQILERIGIDTNTFSPSPRPDQVSPVNRENPNPSIGNTNFSLRFVGVSTVPKDQLGDVMTRFEEEGGSTGELKWE